ncbi:TIGR03089 family protein [Nocardioides currus]|uniref:TIGR03089 family protein n=1 Tax=Nocardioides currus TaxID=2133958 RepID=A0A2R7Z0M3_9ACTN|nr:TIGR03089 family protein [Nocardioides currus]PUA82165.1 TIGR03089 family protein [Nocardioides currus]
MTTFSSELARQLRGDAGRPFITFYDHETDERVELSLTTFANWVSKAAGLLVEEADLERGMRLRLDLPTHWLGPVFLAAAWTVGLTVTDDADPDAVVCGPDTLDAWAARADDLPVLACSLRPLGVRFAEPVPAGVHDVGIEIWTQPDAFTAWDPPTDADEAVSLGDLALTQGALMEAAAAGSVLTDGGRLFSATNPASPPGIVTVTEPLVRGGSLVLVRHLAPERSQSTYDEERATHRI